MEWPVSVEFACGGPVYWAVYHGDDDPVIHDPDAWAEHGHGAFPCTREGLEEWLDLEGRDYLVELAEDRFREAVANRQGSLDGCPAVKP